VSPSDPLPIDAVIPQLRDALARAPAVVLEAPPGAGKTTRVPLAVLGEPWLAGQAIVMLEPRRLAARAAARRMAATLGENVGETVGYRVRFDARVSAKTRVEVATEGVVTRRLQSDPGLSGVGLLVFDEFHERSLDADTALAFAIDAQRALRPDLKILVMSATIEGERIAALLGGAPVVQCDVAAHPVTTRYAVRSPARTFEEDVAALVARAHGEEEGSVLAFLPGEREIRRVEALLADRGIVATPLYGALSPEEQDRAIRAPEPGARKIVLATTIAETSLTIEGVRIVVDGGMKRVPRFDPRTGMTRLETVRVSRASATQRRGRAGRLGPGACYRLWAEPEERAFAAFDTPEILDADLAGFALELAQWGTADPTQLVWLDPPPRAAFVRATGLLRGLGAIDGAGRITDEGRAMAALPLHPRLAHMVHKGTAMGEGALACDLAALLSERDARNRETDVRTRLDKLGGAARDAARQLRGIAGVKGGRGDPTRAGALLALAYPDRIAERRGQARYRLSGGGGAYLADTDPLASAPYLAVAETDGAADDARIYLAAPIARDAIDAIFADQIQQTDVIAWDERDETVIARRRRMLGALALDDKPLADADPDAVRAAMLEGVRRIGIPWTPEARALAARVAFARRLRPDEEWPDLSDAALLEALAPYLAGMTRRAHLARLDLRAVIENLLPRGRLERVAPTHITVPSGSRIPLDYSGETPTLRVRLQEMFGLAMTPTIADGAMPVTLELLSPAQRPLAVTRDLASFWQNVYPQVRAELRGRYPKHSWPDDPLSAAPTARTKRRSTAR